MNAFVPLITVAVVPLLAGASRSWFFTLPRSIPVWAALAGAALLAAAAAVKIIPGHLGGAVLAATPLLQAVVFVVADRLFFFLIGRVPVSSDEARWRRRPDGRRWWPDTLFWILVFSGLMGLGVFLCGHFDVAFPTRQ